jgi:hypothetical protein
VRTVAPHVDEVARREAFGKLKRLLSGSES